MPGAAIGAAAGIGGALISKSASDRASRAQVTAASDAADAQRYATDQSISYLTHGADQGQAMLQPIVDQGDTAQHMWQGAMGTGGTNQPQYAQDYNTGFTQSPYWQNAAYSTQQGIQALNSIMAARGQGGITSGQGMRAASDIANTYRGEATDKYMSGLSAAAGEGNNARLAIANARIGQGSQIASALGNQGNQLAAIYQNRGNNLASIAGDQGMANAGFFGNFMSGLQNTNWGGVSKQVGNFFNPTPPKPITTKPAPTYGSSI